MNAPPPVSLTRLLETHARVLAAFALHQEALLDLDFPAALRHLEAHAATLRAHIREEDGTLLPVYATRAGRVPGGAPEQFLAEHRHIEELVAGLRQDVAALRLDQPGLRARVIAIFDREALYKHLLEHHDRRERSVLYPVLDGVTSPEERRRMLADCPTLARPDTEVAVLARTFGSEPS